MVHSFTVYRSVGSCVLSQPGNHGHYLTQDIFITTDILCPLAVTALNHLPPGLGRH